MIIIKLKISKSKVFGEVSISGSKNASLPIICGALLSNKKCVIKNVPSISDINKLIEIIRKLGKKIIFKNNIVKMSGKITYQPLLFSEIKEFRASYYLIGVFLYLFNKVEIYLPGGCNIGSRPINYHLEGFENTGYICKITDGILRVYGNKEKSMCYTLPKKSLGATINLIMVALRRTSLSVIKNISLEPEVIDFINFMRKRGYLINLVGSDCYVLGSEKSYKIKYRVIPDRVEAYTFIVLGLLNGPITIKNAKYSDLLTPIKLLKANGAKIKEEKGVIYVTKSKIRGLRIETNEYPGFPTDMESISIPLALFSDKASVIKENIFENRFNICKEFIKLGANIDIDKTICKIYPNNNYMGGELIPTDLRGAAAALVYAVTVGDSIICNLNYLERGYEDIYNKLKKLNIDFEFVD